MDAIETKGRAKGGLARAKKLPSERKTEIAKNAAIARWGAKATHKGNFKEKLDIDVECYVLDDVAKTAVISKTGLAIALGLSARGNTLPRFLSNKIMSQAVSAELAEKFNNPIKFQLINPSAGVFGIAHGFDSTVLIDICTAIISVEDKLGDRYANLIKNAHVIVGASAKSGIKNLVYALAGYNPSSQEIINAFKAYIQEEAKKYEKEFPDELYMEWHRLYNIPVPVRGKPWHFKHLTVKHIYYPLAKSNGKILDLLRALRSKDGDRNKKLFQFLNDIGNRALRMQLGRILEMAQSSPDQKTYDKKIVERFGGQQELDFGSPNL